MAYLKSSQITGLSAKDVDVKGFTQAASINLGDRLYSEHEVLLADAYNITGDVTISDNLILAKLSDDGNAITLTGNASTTQTISGSGSLEGSTFAQTPNASLTGMTGVVGSAVTGSPALNLGNTTGTLESGVTGGSGLNAVSPANLASGVLPVGVTGGSGLTALGTVASGTIGSGVTGTLGSGVTFPAGHTLKWAQFLLASDVTSTGTSYVNIISTTFTPTKNNSKVYAYVFLALTTTTTTGTSDNRKDIAYDITGDDITNVAGSGGAWDLDYYGNDEAIRTWHHGGIYIALPAVTLDGTGTATITYVIKMKNENAHANSGWTAHGDGATESSITITEVAV